MTRPEFIARQYRGVTIARSGSQGFWTAYVADSRTGRYALTADTLAGMRSLIRDALDGPR